MIYFVTYILPNLSVLGLFCAGALWLIKKAIESVTKAVPTYLNEKAKNLASKQDIAEITREVEKVKEEFSSKTEQLKTNLQFYNQLRVSIKTEERNSIVDCYNKFHLWLNLLTSIAYGNSGEKGIESIDKRINDIDSAYSQLLLAESLMRLYVGNGKYAQDFSALKIKTLHLNNFQISKCVEFRGALEKFVEQKLYFTTQGDFKSIREAMQTSHAEVSGIAQASRDEMLKQLAEIVQLETRWQIASLEKLTVLASQVNQEIVA